MANTVIQLKYSTVTNAPPSLNIGEPAYSYQSNTLFIGTPDGASAIAIGGKFYLDQQQIIFDKANTNSTLAQDAYDAANNAFTQGGQVAFAQANAAYDQANTATTLAQGSYNQANTATTIAQGAFDTANTKFASAGGTISGDVAITGNLIISGNTITQDVQNISTEDSLIKLAANNAGDAIDIGFYGQYNDGTTKYAGLIRDASNEGKRFKLFAGEDTDPSGNVVSYDVANRATLDANLEADTVEIRGFNILDKTNSAFDLANTNSTLAQNAYNQANTATTIASGSFNQANAVFDLANGTAGIANTDVTNISITGAHHGSASAVAAFRVEANGRISSANSTSIAIATSQITSGTLSVERGGTGNTTFTANGVLLGQGTSAVTTVSSSTEGHVLTINSGGVPTFAMLSGGTF
jgi:3-polyprenyl-4-hydroxybenzoate decarboxylase